MQPVHSWKCSQMTDGFSPLAAASAHLTPTDAGRPTATAAMVQTRRKSRRSIP